MLRFMLVALCFSFFAIANASASVFSASPRLDNTCGSVSGPTPWTYCVSKTRGSRNLDVIYQLHGSGGSERVWIDDDHGREMRDVWKKNGDDAPVVVTISFGKFWMLVAKNAAPKSGLADYVVDTVIPYVEDKLLANKVGRRKLLGISMGGFNAASLMLLHPEMFSTVALTCPALLRLSPYANDQDIDAYIARSPGGDPDSIHRMVRMTGAYFPSAESWDSSSPLPLAKRKFNRTFPALYVSCGDTDEFGIIEGAKDIADAAQAAGMKTEWHPLHGGHCVMDTTSMANFLIDN